MSKLRIVNLLDDFAMGGVTNCLSIFNAPELAEIGDFETIAVDPKAVVAPRFAADIIITHFPPNWRRIAFFHSLRRRNPQARLIHVEHSYSKDWAQLHVPAPARFRAMLRLALKPFDDVVVVSQAQRQWLVEAQMVDLDKLRVIHPYSNMPGLAAVPEMKLGPDAPLIVGAYGRFCPAKGFDRLIDAFKRTDGHDNMELLIGGMGADEAALQARAAGCSRISFVGQVTDVAGFLARCHVIAVPSRFEAYGQVANEAREAGRPILVSTAGGLPEQVGEAGLVVDCHDPETLLAALQSLRAQPLEAMGQAGRAATRRDRESRVGGWCKLLAPAQYRLANRGYAQDDSAEEPLAA